MYFNFTESANGYNKCKLVFFFKTEDDVLLVLQISVLHCDHGLLFLFFRWANGFKLNICCHQLVASAVSWASQERQNRDPQKTMMKPSPLPGIVHSIMKFIMSYISVEMCLKDFSQRNSVYSYLAKNNFNKKK